MRYHIPEAHKTCLVLPKTLTTGSLRRKFANRVPENTLNIDIIQQTSGCLREKYNEPVANYDAPS